MFLAPSPSPPKRDNWEDGHIHNSMVHLGQFIDASSWLPIGQRLQHMTWAWFTTTMSTGGLALLFHTTPHRFAGLDIIGRIVYIFNLVLFVLITASMGYRFAVKPKALKHSLTHPTESLFFPAFLLSFATILTNAAAYGVPNSGPWLATAIYVLFWIYAGLSTMSAIVQFFILFRGESLSVHSMTPAWILPIFPVMLVGTLAASISPTQSPERRIAMLVAGVTYQGLGWTVACLVYPLYLGRLMQDGLPAPAMRPAMFMAVGPAGFTTVAIIGMARAIPVRYGYFGQHPMAQEVLRIMATWVGIWIWCIGFWFFAISLISVVESALNKQLRFSLSWWAFVFPNVGFTVATAQIGQELGSEAIQWVASAMTILIVVMYFIVAYAQVVAVKRKAILWPKDHSK
ncbi:hypothetical protein V2G26_002780 [Clonostachys chloroleuca]